MKAYIKTTCRIMWLTAVSVMTTVVGLCSFSPFLQVTFRKCTAVKLFTLPWRVWWLPAPRGVVH